MESTKPVAYEAPASNRQVPGAAPAGRIGALDWVKGALVVLMVVYHSINYSVFRPLAFEYLDFLPASFILITGFVVGQIYATKYKLGTWTPYIRLFTRGLKLLAIFTLLNLAFFIANERSVYHGLGEFAERADAIFLYATGRVGIFEVLLPIAYFLMLAPLLLWLRLRARQVLVVLSAGVFAACVVMETKGVSFKQPTLLSAGLLGMISGFIPVPRLEAIARPLVLPIVFFVIYQGAEHLFGGRYAVQMFGASACVLLLFAFGLRVESSRFFGASLAILGQYSLIGYLLQIALLQALVKGLGRPGTVPALILLGALTLALTALGVAGARWLRAKMPLADLAYKHIFG